MDISKTRRKTYENSVENNSRKSRASTKIREDGRRVRLNKTTVLRAAANREKVTSGSGTTERRRPVRTLAKSALKTLADNDPVAVLLINKNNSPRQEARGGTSIDRDAATQGLVGEIHEDSRLQAATSDIRPVAEGVDGKVTSAPLSGPPSRSRSPTESIRTEESISSDQCDQVVESLKQEVMTVVRIDLEQEKEDTTIAMNLASHAAKEVTSIHKTVARLNKDLKSLITSKAANSKVDTDMVINWTQCSVERIAAEKAEEFVQAD